jgi:peptide/nickel transport system ATP-binding protein
MNSIPKLANRSHTRLEVIAGRPPDLVNPPKGCRFAPRCRYAQPKCFEHEPPLVQGENDGHFFRCWFPVGTPEGQFALQRNEQIRTARAAQPATAGGAA